MPPDQDWLRLRLPLVVSVDLACEGRYWSGGNASGHCLDDGAKEGNGAGGWATFGYILGHAWLVAAALVFRGLVLLSSGSWVDAPLSSASDVFQAMLFSFLSLF